MAVDNWARATNEVLLDAVPTNVEASTRPNRRLGWMIVWRLPVYGVGARQHRVAQQERCGEGALSDGVEDRDGGKGEHCDDTRPVVHPPETEQAKLEL